MDDPVAYPHDPVIREVVLQEVTKVLDRGIVTQLALVP
jgi:hypothetical protein